MEVSSPSNREAKVKLADNCGHSETRNRADSVTTALTREMGKKWMSTYCRIHPKTESFSTTSQESFYSGHMFQRMHA